MEKSDKFAISREEWRPVLIAAGGIMLLTLVPYLLGYLLSETPYRFVGMVFNLEDYRTYLAKMWLGYRGEWLYTSTFTTEEHPGVLFFLFYILLGHAARLLGLSLPFIYQLARMVAGMALLLKVYQFAAAFLPRPARWYAFLLIATASGLGWLRLFWPMPWLGRNGPMDQWVPESNVFFSLYAFPHFILSFYCIIGFFLNALTIIESDGASPVRGPVIRAAIYGVITGIIHPYMVLPLGLISGLYLLWRTIKAKQLTWRPWLLLAGIGLVLLPIVAYSSYVFAFVPYYREWQGQSATWSPPVSNYLMGYGLLWPLAVWGAWRLRPHARLPFLLIWIGATFILVYTPPNIQRRFIEGVHLPIGLLAGAGLSMGLVPWLAHRLATLKERYPQRIAGWRWLALTGIVLFLALSNFMMVLSHTLVVMVQDSILYYRDDDAAALAWLLAQNSWHEPVLSADETGNLLGGQIGQKVVLGHWSETMNAINLLPLVAEFYGDEMEDSQRQRWLDEWGAVYVYHGRYERKLGSFDPAQADYLEPVFQQGEVTLYRVLR